MEQNSIFKKKNGCDPDLSNLIEFVEQKTTLVNGSMFSILPSMLPSVILFNVTFIVIRIPSYSIKLHISKMNWSFSSKLTKNPLTSSKTYW